MQQFVKIIIIIGVLFVAIGLILYLHGGKWFSWLGRLPGDIRIEKDHFRFYFPITTMIIISVVLSLLFRLFRRFF